MDSLSLHTRLKASSLLEAVVASVLFMTVFTLSLETIGQITLHGEDHHTLIAMDNALQNARKEYTQQPHENISLTRDFPWGTLDIILSPYQESPDLQLLRLKAENFHSHRVIQWRQILYNPEKTSDHENP